MATVTQAPGEITLAASGTSDPIYLLPGVWELDLYATSWDSGNPVTVEFAKENTSARYEVITDPANVDADISRSAKGKPIIFETAGGFLRINASTIGTTTGLTLSVGYLRP